MPPLMRFSSRTRTAEPEPGVDGAPPPPPSPAPRRRRLGDLLVGRGMVDQDQLAVALARQQRDGGRLGRLLVEEGIIDEGSLLKALADQAGTEVVDLRHLTPSPEATARVPAEVARALELLPISREEGVLTVAVGDPSDARLGELQVAPDVLRLVVAAPADILAGINLAYRALVGVERHVAAFEADRKPVEARADSLDLPANAPVVQVVDMLLTQALRDRASDVHIEPLEGRLRVRFRIDGVMHEVVDLPVGMAGALASRLKVMAEMNIVETRRPQDGQLEVSVDGRALDVRVATAPTIWGEKVVLRLLDRSRSLLAVGELGMSTEAHERYTAITRSPYGMVLCSGPTGSGKTTTLYATLGEINRAEVNVMTIEDPVEYIVPTVNQLHVSEQAGVTFASGLRAILRQDPDVILVGEIRDVETARIAVQSSLTGHFVLSSLHATDSASALVRLVDMGVEPFLIAASVVGVVGQRLVRRLCRSCVVEYELLPEEAAFWAASGGPAKERFLRGAGCNFCSGTGYLDRIGVYELLTVNDEIRQLVLENPSAQLLREAASRSGMSSLREEGLRLVAEDVTTVAEVMRAIYVL